MQSENGNQRGQIKPERSRRLVRTFVRALNLLLITLIAAAVFLALDPAALSALMTTLPIPGSVVIPTPGPTLAPPAGIPAGPLPVGHQAYNGRTGSGAISCGFLLQLDDGERVGISAAHATPPLPAGRAAEFYTPDGALVAHLTAQIERGGTFIHDQLNMDYVIWSLAGPVDAGRFLQPDPRGSALPGEPVWVYSPYGDGAGGPKTYPGVVMSSSPQATWIQMAVSFSPAGFSGCPVISQLSGRLVGMAVAGRDMPPVVLGLNPVGSLVGRAQAALNGK